MLAGLFGLTIAALFTGAALYINIAEHPSRLTLDNRSMLAQWKPAYERGYRMQATLAGVGFVLGFLSWWQTGKLAFMLGGVFMVANWPWTLFAILPVTKHLMGIEPSEAGASTRMLMERWNALHAVRTFLGVSATVAFLVGLSLP
jgi:ABC-type spermidine/putrescine transport system permease subunit I